MDEATAKRLAADIVSLRYSEHRVAEILLTASRPAPGYLRASEGCEFCRDCDAQRCPENVRSVLFKIAEQSAKGHYFNVHHHTAELLKVCSENLRLLLQAAARTAAESAKGGH